MLGEGGLIACTPFFAGDADAPRTRRGSCYPGTSRMATVGVCISQSCSREVPHVGVGAGADLLMLDTPSHPYLGCLRFGRRAVR